MYLFTSPRKSTNTKVHALHERKRKRKKRRTLNKNRIILYQSCMHHFLPSFNLVPDLGYYTNDVYFDIFYNFFWLSTWSLKLRNISFSFQTGCQFDSAGF